MLKFQSSLSVAFLYCRFCHLPIFLQPIISLLLSLNFCPCFICITAYYCFIRIHIAIQLIVIILFHDYLHFAFNPDFAVGFFYTNCQNTIPFFAYYVSKIILGYQSVKVVKSNCFAVEILSNNRKCLHFFLLQNLVLNNQDVFC